MNVAPGPNVLVMDALSDLVAMATGVNPTISLKIWLIPKVLDFAYTRIYSFLYLYLYLFSYLISII